jgi:hypothetical protein
MGENSMKLLELENIVQKSMLLQDKSILKLICAIVVAGRLPVNPPWMVIVGSPSGGKSSLLTALESCPDIHKIDDLTPNTFFSGSQGKNGEDNSLVTKLNPNSVLTMKDFSTILSKKDVDLGIIMAQLRRLYDGDFGKTWGNGKAIDWHGKVSLLIGATHKIYNLLPQLADLGERFMLYEFEQPERLAHGMKGTETLDDRPAKKEMREAFAEFLGGIKLPDVLLNIDDTIRKELVDLADFATRARSAVPRNKFAKGQPVEQIIGLEAPPRFAKQLISIAVGLRTINESEKQAPVNGLFDNDLRIIYKVSLDSIPNTRRLILKTLTYFAKVETKGVGLKIGYPTETVRIWLQDLAILGVVIYTKKSNQHDLWELQPNYRQLMSRYEHIEMTDKILLDEEEPAIPENVPEFMIER